MGSSRQQNTSSTTPLKDRDTEVAGAVAATLAAGGGVGAVAALFLPLLPVALLQAPELAAQVAHEAATLSSGKGLEATGASTMRNAAWLEELAYRGLYAVQALRRLATGAMEGQSMEEHLAGLHKTVQKEGVYFEQHSTQAGRRDAARRMVAAASELHAANGLLGWVHGKAERPRPSHLAADGKNFRVGVVPVQTGALPGALPGCTCTVSAPFPGADVMA